MPNPHAPDTSDEMVQRAIDVYDRVVRPKIRPEDKDKFLAIDLVSGDFEVHEDDYTAVKQLKARRPNGDIWLMQSDGSPAYFLGSGR